MCIIYTIWKLLSGHESTVRLLIGNGANVNIVNKFNNSALILALYKGIRWKNLWNCSLKDAKKKTAIYFPGFENIAELLIRNGADVNVVGQHAYTALILAALNGT